MQSQLTNLQENVHFMVPISVSEVFLQSKLHVRVLEVTSLYFFMSNSKRAHAAPCFMPCIVGIGREKKFNG